MVAHAKTPALNKDGLPVKNGKTRTVNHELQYLDPMTDEWEPAVRLADIRQRILQQTAQTYSIPKKHGNGHGREPLNYTSYLDRDQQYGSSRPNRNPILFQLKHTDKGSEPTGYEMDGGRIILDAFDHGIRDFVNAMPLCLSTEIEGHDIETYKRRNLKIAMYDLIARMPGKYWTGKDGQTRREKPPRSGSVSMRATRFRLSAFCLTWNEKGDSEAKNAKMMSLMDPGVRALCESMNSSIAFRDLEKWEQEQCETAKGHRPSKASKAKRAKKAKESQEPSDDDDQADENEDSNEFQGDRDDYAGQEEAYEPDSDDDDGVEEEENADADGEDEEEAEPPARPIAKPTSRKCMHHRRTGGNLERQQDTSASASEHLQCNKGRKHSRNSSSSVGDLNEDDSQLPRKHRRIAKKQQDLEEFDDELEPAVVRQRVKRRISKKATPHVSSSRADAERITTLKKAIANPLGAPKSVDELEKAGAFDFLYEEESDTERDTELQAETIAPQEPDIDGTENENISDGYLSDGVVNDVEPESRLPEGPSTAGLQEDEAEQAPATLRKVKRGRAPKGPAHSTLAATMRSASRNGSSIAALDVGADNRRKSKQAIREHGLKTATYINPQDILPSPPQYALTPTTQAPNHTGIGFGLQGLASASTSDDLFSRFTDYDALGGGTVNPTPEDDNPDVGVLPPTDNDLDQDAQGSSSNVDSLSTDADQGAIDKLSFDPNCKEFKDQVAAGIEAGDYRFISPKTQEDVLNVAHALDLSRADIFEKIGHMAPEDVLSGYENESYAIQQQQLEVAFENERIKAGMEDREVLYCLPKWTGGFENWQYVLCFKGSRLADATRDYQY